MDGPDMGKTKKKGKGKAKSKPYKGKVKVLEGGRLKIFQAVKGLVRDGRTVAKLIRAERPDIVALGLAPEELDGLRSLMKSGEDYEPELSNIDMAYAKNLGEFGDVAAPPPCFTRAIQAADKLCVPVVALDLDIVVHTDIYVNNVVLSDLLRQSMKFRMLKKKKFRIETPEEFALTWDHLLNKAQGFSKVEQAREECMAGSLEVLLEEDRLKNIVVVIEIERAEGTIDKLFEKIEKANEGSKKKKKVKRKK